MRDWLNFFEATARGALTITGLVFVGLSLNLQKILAFGYLPNRALDALMLIVNIFIVSILSLVPQQACFLGVEILTLDVFLVIVILKMDIRMYRMAEPAFRRNFRKLTF